MAVDDRRDDSTADRPEESDEAEDAAVDDASTNAEVTPAASTDGGSSPDPERTGAESPSSDGETGAEESDGSIPCRSEDCEATFETRHGMKIHHSKVHRGDGEAPPYEDPDALREVYERHETFAAMTEALEVDVTPNTVRRYMIEHGIHAPGDGRASGAAGVSTDRESPDRRANDGGRDGDALETSPITDGSDDTVPVGSEDTGENGSDDADEDGSCDAGSDTGAAEENRRDGADGDGPDPDYRIPDDVDLPRNVTLEDVATAVASSSTVFEVGRELRVSRERAQRLLRELGLLDLVSRRLDDRADDGLWSEIDARLRATAEASSA